MVQGSDWGLGTVQVLRVSCSTFEEEGEMKRTELKWRGIMRLLSGSYGFSSNAVCVGMNGAGKQWDVGSMVMRRNGKRPDNLLVSATTDTFFCLYRQCNPM